MDYFKFNIFPLNDKVFQINNQFYYMARESQPTTLNDLIIPIRESKFDNIFVDVEKMKTIQVTHALQDKTLILNHSYLGTVFKTKDVLSAVCMRARDYIDLFVMKPDCIYLYSYDLNQEIRHTGTFYKPDYDNPKEGYSVADLHRVGVVEFDKSLHLWVPDAPDVNDHSFIFCGREDPFRKGGDESPQVH